METTLNDKISKIIECCLSEKDSINPIRIAKTVMHMSFINMHGVEHHFLDGAAFLTAMRNAGVDFDLLEALTDLSKQALKMPGAMCGYWGVCGSTASVGSALAILHGTGPLSSNEYYKDNMEYTSKAISAMAKIGGPRCCKRNAFISILTAIDFVAEKYRITLQKEPIFCEFSKQNSQCLTTKCPFYPHQNL
ncbi:MAG: DUF5714 domain-containing protein [Clostridia bacterium]